MTLAICQTAAVSAAETTFGYASSCHQNNAIVNNLCLAAVSRANASQTEVTYRCESTLGGVNLVFDTTSSTVLNHSFLSVEAGSTFCEDEFERENNNTDLLLAVNNDLATAEADIDALQANDTVQDNRLTSVESQANTIQVTQNTILADAALLEGRVGLTESDIVTLQDRAALIELDVNQNVSDISQLNTDLQTNVSNLQGNININTANDLSTSSTLQANIDANTAIDNLQTADIQQLSQDQATYESNRAAADAATNSYLTTQQLPVLNNIETGVTGLASQIAQNGLKQDTTNATLSGIAASTSYIESLTLDLRNDSANIRAFQAETASHLNNVNLGVQGVNSSVLAQTPVLQGIEADTQYIADLTLDMRNDSANIRVFQAETASHLNNVNLGVQGLISNQITTNNTLSSINGTLAVLQSLDTSRNNALQITSLNSGSLVNQAVTSNAHLSAIEIAQNSLVNNQYETRLELIESNAKLAAIAASQDSLVNNQYETRLELIELNAKLGQTNTSDTERNLLLSEMHTYQGQIRNSANTLVTLQGDSTVHQSNIASGITEGNVLLSTQQAILNDQVTQLTAINPKLDSQLQEQQTTTSAVNELIISQDNTTQTLSSNLVTGNQLKNEVVSQTPILQSIDSKLTNLQVDANIGTVNVDTTSLEALTTTGLSKDDLLIAEQVTTNEKLDSVVHELTIDPSVSDQSTINQVRNYLNAMWETDLANYETSIQEAINAAKLEDAGLDVSDIEIIGASAMGFTAAQSCTDYYFDLGFAETGFHMQCNDTAFLRQYLGYFLYVAAALLVFNMLTGSAVAAPRWT